MFNPARLLMARRRRSLTMKALADRVAVEPRTVSAWESGEFPPKDENLQALAQALRFPLDFFSRDNPDEVDPEGVSFRALTKMTARQREAALSAGAIAFELHDWIAERFVLPSPDLLDLRGEDPEIAASTLRRHWKLGDRSIRNMVHLLESKGARVFSLAEDAREVDAYSLWRGATPFIFLNTLKSAEHNRHDAAHELGHLVLHKHGAQRGSAVEREADSFAAAFLMPAVTVGAAVSRVPTLTQLVLLKRHWVVSVASLAYRLHKLGLVSEWHYRSLCIEMSELGYRRREPEEAPRETSQVLAKVLLALRDDRVTKAVLAEELAVPVDEIEKIVFGLVVTGLTPISAKQVQPRQPTGNLRLVK
jgi:Zn-dependent peptidase ImmA (M78 family)/DNA-binding XRE family transcriptional regulator